MADENNQTQALEGAPAEGKEDGFSAAFAERSADPAGQAAKSQEDEEGKSPSSEKEPAEAGSAEAPAEKTAATEQTTSGAATADPLDELTPEQLRQRLRDTEAERSRLQQSDRSQRGRLGALTRKYNELEAKLKAPKEAPKAGEEGASSEGGNADEDAEYRRTVEEYNDVVGPMAKKLEELQAKIDKIEQPASTASEIDKDAEELTKAIEDLEREHPDLAQHGPGSDFDKWLADQPEKIASLANSFDPAEVSLVLSKFKLERSAAIASQSGEGGEEKGKQESTATDDKRKRQLEGSRQVPGKGQPAAAGVPNDFSSAFKARSEAQAKA